jgi:hypothetical protein
MRTLFIDKTALQSKERLKDPPRDGMTLWVEELEQRLFVVLAERSSDPHVTNDRSRYAGRKAFWWVVTARAVLLKDALTLALRHRGLLLDGRFSWRLGCRCTALLRHKPER